MQGAGKECAGVHGRMCGMGNQVALQKRECYFGGMVAMEERERESARKRERVSAGQIEIKKLSVFF